MTWAEPHYTVVSRHPDNLGVLEGTPADQVRVAQEYRLLLPPDLRGELGGVVYFFDCGGFTKVGYTTQPAVKYVRGFTTKNPFDVTIWALIRSNWAQERAVHASLNHCHHRGEWYLFDSEMRTRIAGWVIRHGGETYY